jgi:ribosomal protein L21
VHNETARACVEVGGEQVGLRDEALFKVDDLQPKRAMADYHVETVVLLHDHSVRIGTHGLAVVADRPGKDRG